MTDLMERLEKWGADPVEAIHRMLDDESLYRSLLEKFVKKKEWELFQSAIEERDYYKAFRLAHDIKGSAAVLSLTPIYDVIKVLVEQLREGEPDDAFVSETEVFFRECKMLENMMSMEST